MRADTVRPDAVRWIRGVLFAGALWPALDALSFSPAAVVPLFALATGVAAVYSGPFAVALAIALLSLPLLATDLVTGVVFLIAGVAFFQLLARHRGSGFLLVAYGVLLAGAGPVWAVAGLAGVLLGATAGAAVAALTCVTAQVAGGLAGMTHVGTVATGLAASQASALGAPPADMLGLGWLEPSVAAADPGTLLGALAHPDALVLLVLQAAAWAAGAALAAAVLRPAASPHRRLSAVAAGAAGVVAAATLHLATLGYFDALPETGAGVPFATSVACAMVLIAAREWLLPVSPAVRRAAPRPLVRDDGDVEGLLGLIATAEDELVARHAVHATVLITDVQAFSELTEQEGSLASAKVIQRKRDLLMPLIAGAGGRGKPTGGDGLVATFSDPRSAVLAAVEMQRALARHNSTGGVGRTIEIRTGIASGEVVLDGSGKPFIGSAVNLAARVMRLAEGGQVLVTREVADAAHGAGIAIAPRGAFDLKNIGTPVEVAEVRWSEASAAGGNDARLPTVASPSNAKAPA